MSHEPTPVPLPGGELRLGERLQLPLLGGVQGWIHVVASPAVFRSLAISLLTSVLLGLISAGCTSTKPNVPPPAAPSQTHIDELNVLAMPVAINLDAAPGVDGFAIQVYAVDRSLPKTQPIRGGTLEVLMYDGLLKEIVSDTNQYRHVWSFPASQLKPYAATTTIGVSYRFTLNWGTDKPRDDKFTLIVRYRPDRGSEVYSAPSSIAIPSK